MTRYTVVWEEDIKSDLARIWLNSSQRSAVAIASDAIDRELAEEARVKGTIVTEGLRALTKPPLRVLFAVRGDDRIVEVVRVVEI